MKLTAAAIFAANSKATQAAAAAAGATQAAAGATKDVKGLKDEQSKSQDLVKEALKQLEKVQKPIGGRIKSLPGEQPVAEEPDFSELKSKLQELDTRLTESSKEFDKKYEERWDRITEAQNRIRRL